MSSHGKIKGVERFGSGVAWVCAAALHRLRAGCVQESLRQPHKPEIIEILGRVQKGRSTLLDLEEAVMKITGARPHGPKGASGQW